jgi:hypothetical protein
MSKVTELEVKYGRISKTVFQKFVNGDVTPTKKYLEYLCIMWIRKLDGFFSISTNGLIDLVNRFDKILPYIVDNKDIYSEKYRRLDNLKSTVSDAEFIRAEKSIVKTDHVDILIENDDYILVCPKTFEGSLRYGANTKWCTASKNNKSTFKTYSESYTLIYLNSKNLQVNNNFNKIAFKLGNYKLSAYVEIYNQLDKSISENVLVQNGWNYDILVEIFSAIRLYGLKKEFKNDTFKKINTITKFMSTIDLVDFHRNLEILKKFDENQVLIETQSIVTEFNEKFKNFLK